LRQLPIRAIPARDPIDHPEQIKRRDRQTHRPQLPFPGKLLDRFPHQIEISPLPPANHPAMRRRQRGHLFENHRHRAAHFENPPRMAIDDDAQSLFGVGDFARRRDHVLLHHPSQN
jgi:hypothetical protein